MPDLADPLASLEPCGIDVSLGGLIYTIPPVPASKWLSALFDDFGSFSGVIELLTVADRAAIEQQIIDGTIAAEDMEAVFHDAVEVASGRTWWVVINYMNLARGFWARFHGRVLASGMNPDKVSFGAYLDAIHFAFIEGREEQGIQKITNFLETPPPGVKIDLDEDSEGETFLAMLNGSR